MPKRRSLDFQTFDDFSAELRALRDRPYDRAGQWTLGQVCRHLNMAISQSMDGFVGIHVSRLLKLIAPIALAITLKSRKMPAGVQGPKPWMPGDVGEDATEVDALLAAIDRFKAHTGELHPSPLFGRLTRDRWTRLHLIHAAHHLGFIVPRLTDDAR